MPPTYTDEGLVAAEEIRNAYPGVGVLVLSQYLEPRYALRLLEHHPEGVGYLLKERVSDVAVLADAIRRIAEASACSIRRSSPAWSTGPVAKVSWTPSPTGNAKYSP